MSAIKIQFLAGLIFYITSDTTISLKNSVELNLEYRNLLLDSIPQKFTSIGSLWVFGTLEHPQKQGDIYDYINGAAEPFLEHGFEMVINQNYKDSANRIIKVDIYYMQNEDSALALFKDPRLRTNEDSLIDIGAKGIAYNPVPNYFLEFYRRCLYVRIYTDNDYAASKVNELAKFIDDKIKLLEP